jgi:hypothetical protein
MRALKGVLLVVFVLSAFGVNASPAQAQTEEYKVYLPMIMNNYISAGINITYVPPCRSGEKLKGNVANVVPAQYKVAIYIFVSGGWWTKPTFASPLTTIAGNGTWESYVNTGGNDGLATRFAAFLVPNGYTPPQSGGYAEIPGEIFSHAVAYTYADRTCSFRLISFSGYTWQVKDSVAPAGPGPNYFSSDVNDVFVDSAGLHLKIVNHGGVWYCTEVVNTSFLGYGTYVFQLGTDVGLLDKNAVLGMFTWDDTSSDYYYREIDIEYSRWDDPGYANSQFVVQPYWESANIYRWETTLPGSNSTSGFKWTPTAVLFKTFEGLRSFLDPNGIIQSWNYTGDNIPPEGKEQARINLWLFHPSVPPAGTVEVIIKSFTFTPYP